MIRTRTRIERLLCWLGFHLWFNFKETAPGSVFRGVECLRCGKVVGKYSRPEVPDFVIKANQKYMGETDG